MANMTFDFSGKSVLVTGGASGIGLTLVQKYLQAGAQVAVWDFAEKALDSLKSEAGKLADKLHTQQVDVTDRNSCQKAAAALPWNVDILVNNAGITRDKSFAKLTPEDWDSVINTNLSGLFNVTKALFDKMNQSTGPRRIINISSVVGIYGNFGQANYAAAKAGVIGLTKTLAKELGRKGFTVNAIAPGFISTPMTQAMPAEVLTQMAAKVPVARLGETDDIAHACLFLSSQEAGYINGAVLSVDGGIVL